MSLKHLPRLKHDKKHDIQDKAGKSLNNLEDKDLVGIRTKRETKEILDSGRTTRSQTSGTSMTLRYRKNRKNYNQF